MKMSTNSVRKYKNASRKEKNKHETNSPEVFVMPPNILEKLGINLGHICGPSQTKLVAEEIQDLAVNLKEVKDLKSSNIKVESIDNGSILETANLMKKSVFLSPTFIQTDSNIITGEVEMSKTVFDTKEIDVVSMTQPFEKPVLILENNEKKENGISSLCSNNVELYKVEVGCWNENGVHTTLIDNENAKIVGNENLNNLQAIEIVPSDNNLDIESTDVTFDDKKDEVHSPGFSNIKLPLDVQKSSEPKQKVTILSEERVDSTQLNKIFTPLKTILTPVSVNTLISKTSICPSEFEIKNTVKDSLEHLISADLNVVNIKNEVASNEYDLCNNNISIQTYTDHENSIKTASKYIPQSNMLQNEIRASLSVDKAIDNTTDISVDSKYIISDNHCKNESVTEDFDLKDTEKKIAATVDADVYEKLNMNTKINLAANEDQANSSFKIDVDIMVKSNVADLKNHSIANDVNAASPKNSELTPDAIKESNKNITVDKVSEIATYLTSFFKSGNRNSMSMKKNIIRESEDKLSVHGVEKPGGTKQIPKESLQYDNIRTYQRKNIPKPPISSTIFNDNIQNASNIIIANNFVEDITMKPFPATYKIGDFCICSDFGILSTSNIDNSYEHIHFQNQKKIICDLDIIFDIYNDNSDYPSINNVIPRNNKSIDDNNVSDLDFNICWNNIPVRDSFMNDTDLFPCPDGPDQPVQHAYNNSVEPVLSDSEPVKPFEEKGSNTKEKTIEDIFPSENDEEDYLQQLSNKIEEETLNCIAEEDNYNRERNMEMKKEKQTTTTPKNDEKTVPSPLDIAEQDSSLCTTEDFLKSEECPIETNVKQKITTSTPNSSKRKRRLSAVQDKRHNEISKCKVIKCGVCKMMLQEINWETHVSMEHCYVAWQDGATVDWEAFFDSKVLIDKLNDKLKMEGTLTCTLCKLKLNKVSRFVNHVKKYLDGGEETLKAHINEKEIAKCGVCAQDVEVESWMDHIAKIHHYMAWKEGEPALDLTDDALVWEHLNIISKDIGGLVCSKCGLVRKYVKQFLAHIKKCEGGQDHSMVSVDTSVEYSKTKDNIEPEITPLGRGLRQRKMNSLTSTLDTSQLDSDSSVDDSKLDTSNSNKPVNRIKCGVCSQEMDSTDWINHTQKEHNYIAWREDEKPLDLTDATAVNSHLLEVVSEIGCLTCPNCGITKKRPKTYLKHVTACEQSAVMSQKQPTTVSSADTDEPCECGICSEKLVRKNWTNHAMDKHYNLAWIKGEKINDITDKSTVIALLSRYRKKNPLTCKSCGIARKSVLGFYSHIISCGKTEEEMVAFYGKCDICGKKYMLIDKEKHAELHTGVNTEYKVSNVSDAANGDIVDENQPASGDMCQCAVCLKKVPIKKWQSHAMKKHYNIAWVVGDPPLDLDNPYKIDKLLKEYKAVYGRLVCKVCDTSKASSLGFFAHILVCGKTEEEAAQFKALCDICNKMYMRIYEYQHKRAHSDAKLALERKLLAKQKELKEQVTDTVIATDSKRNRKAAEKARNVIEKYSATNNICHKCDKNGADCRCVRKNRERKLSESDPAVQFEAICSDSNHSTDMDVDENVSEEDEMDEKFKSRPFESRQLKTQRIPFQVASEKAYIDQSYKDFCENHLTDEVLFKEWCRFEYEIVSESDIEKYMPPLKESCQIKFTDDWLTLQRFENKKKMGGMCIFTGGSAQCIRWAPARLDDSYGQNGQWLAVAAHLDNDQPRYDVDQLAIHPALIQIWNVGDFATVLPKISLGLAHDYGTVWAMDWCPSGVRDPLPEDKDSFDKPLRLGLLVVACSNGKAYIYSIPYPNTIVKSNEIFIKLKPVVELRITDGEDRKMYQATTVCWSTQQGHSLIIVGYADGTVAFYDINSNSPLLKTTEGKTTVFYPYHDERFQIASITGLGVYPCDKRGSGAGVSGAWCAASLNSASVRVGPPGRCQRANQASLVTNDVVFSPHWPSLLISGEDALVALVVNELEIWGLGRRLGGLRAITTCQRCARVALYAPPYVRVMYTHPIRKEILKHISFEIAMQPIGTKINEKPSKDALTVKLEPNTYDDAVKQYGLKFKIVDKHKMTSEVIMREYIRFRCDIASNSMISVTSLPAAAPLATKSGTNGTGKIS